MNSQKKADLIYGAVHEAVMQLRIQLKRDHQLPDALDAIIAQAGEKAAREAVAAYRKPLHEVGR